MQYWRMCYDIYWIGRYMYQKHILCLRKGGIRMDINKPILPNYETNPSLTSSSGSSVEALRAKESAGKPSVITQDVPRLMLKEGQIIKGEIIDLRYNQIAIRLEPGNQVVHATLEGNLPLAIGQTAQFQVVQGTSEHLLLKYIPSPMQSTAEAMIAKALTASNLPLTNQNKSLVTLLLNHNMSIDTQSLRTLVNLTKRYPDADPRTLILMHKYQIPITKENITQFEAYANQTEQFSSMINELSDTIMELLQTPSNPAFTSTERQHSISESIANYDAQHQNTAEYVLSNENIQTEDNLKILFTIHSTLLEMLDDNLYGNSSKGLQDTPGTVTSETAYTASLQSDEQSALPNTLEQSIKEAFGTLVNSNNENSFNLSKQTVTGLHTDSALQTILNEQEISKLMEHLRSFPDAQSLYHQIAEGTAFVSDILNFVNANIKSGEFTLTQHLLQSPQYSKLLTEALRNKWMIAPQKLGDPDSLKQLYETLEKDMDRLSKLINNSNETLESIRMQEPVKNLQENLSFLKDFNQVFTYLPIPLQFKNQNAHCDLYVLSRKKALKNPKDGLSVLLCLTMEHLGPLNIHIHMESKQISAKFYLEDATAGKLLTKHMDSLTEALHEKGYNLHAEVHDTYKKTDFIEDFVAPDALEMDIQRYTFDVRT